MGTVLTELQDEESVWAEPVDEGLLCWNCIPDSQKKTKTERGKFISYVI